MQGMATPSPAVQHSRRGSGDSHLLAQGWGEFRSISRDPIVRDAATADMLSPTLRRLLLADRLFTCSASPSFANCAVAKMPRIAPPSRPHALPTAGALAASSRLTTRAAPAVLRPVTTSRNPTAFFSGKHAGTTPLSSPLAVRPLLRLGEGSNLSLKACS